MKHLFRLLLLLTAAVMAPQGDTRASCGASSCPVDTLTGQVTEAGFVRVDLGYEYIDQDRPWIGRRSADVGEISGHHNEVATLSEIRRLGLQVGLSPRFSVAASLPFVHREHRHIHIHHGTPGLESWNFNGMGDLTLLGRFALNPSAAGARPIVTLIGGGILPTGRTNAVNAAGDEAEVGIQPGAGAESLILGASTLQRISAPTLNGKYAAAPVFFSSTYQWNDAGKDKYRLGNIWTTNFGVVYPLFVKLGLVAQVNARVNRRDDRGKTFEEVAKTGGTYVFASPGLQLTLADNLWATVLVQLPVYQRVNVIQLTSDSNFTASLSYMFDVR